MFLQFGKGKCPVCGVLGEEVDSLHHECPRCGAKFSEFGVAFAEKNEWGLYWH